MPGIKNFKDKVMVITGAGSGIGRATALFFAEKGVRLVLADLHEDRLKKVAGETKKLGAETLIKKTDVSNKKQVESLALFTVKNFKRVDILHNNAGVSIGARIEDTALEDWEWILKINLWGVIFGIHYFLPYMIRQKSGHIVNTASGLGLAATPGTGAYSSTKFAVVGLSESLRAEVRRYNIGVSAICPGVINTRIIKDGRIKIRKKAKANREKLISFYGKSWSPDRVAKAIYKGIKWNRAVVPVGPEVWLQWFNKRISLRSHNAVNIISEKYLM